MSRPACDDTCTVDCGSCKGGGPAARAAYLRRVKGGTLDTGGPGPVVGDHLGVDGVHRVFRDASPDWVHPYLPHPMLDRYPDEMRQRLQRMAATPEREQLLRDLADQDAAARHDIPLTARDQAIIALAAAAVTALILRAVTRRWWWTA